MKTIIALICLSAPLVCLVASAQKQQRPAGASLADRFAQLDKNGDGKVTREETGNAPWFDTLDRNRDGVITREEAVEAARSKPRPAGGSNSTDTLAYDPDSSRPMPLSESKALTDLRFTRDLIFGTKDRNGKLMTGTECNYLVAHGGRLFAAVSVWNHDPIGPNPGPGVLVKRSAAAPWEVDVQFHPRNVRVPVLASLTFTTDAAGKPLDPPVNLLMSGSGSFEHSGQFTVQVRDDAKDTWLASIIAPSQGVRSFELRQLFVHRDRVTGVDRVIAALTGGSVFSGAYDPAVPGLIRWNSQPELTHRQGRIMSGGEANGDAYLAVDITPDAPKNGGLFRRVDGPQPRWEWIGEWGQRVQHRGVAWIRGLTAIPDPANPGKELLLCSREVDGVIEVIDPQRDHAVRIEFDLRKYFGGFDGGDLGTGMKHRDTAWIYRGALNGN